MSGISVEEELKKETEKWLKRIENLEIIPLNEKGEEFLENIRAYIRDCKYFLARKDLVRAFECVIWAWAWLEIGKELKFLAT